MQCSRVAGEGGACGSMRRLRPCTGRMGACMGASAGLCALGCQHQAATQVNWAIGTALFWVALMRCGAQCGASGSAQL